MSAIPLITATLILLAGVVDDLRSRKVHNWLFLACAAIAALVSVSMEGLGGLSTATIGFLAGLGVLLPLVLLKVVGAGDMKLFAAFGAAAGANAVITVAVFSLIWGALFGVIQVVMKGQLMSTLRNMVAIASMKDRTRLELHKIPFTVAIFVGWLTYLVNRGVIA